MYITILVKQVYCYISQVSSERLQDHWSSGLKEKLIFSILAGQTLDVANESIKWLPFGDKPVEYHVSILSEKTVYFYLCSS